MQQPSVVYQFDSRRNATQYKIDVTDKLIHKYIHTYIHTAILYLTRILFDADSAIGRAIIVL